MLMRVSVYIKRKKFLTPQVQHRFHFSPYQFLFSFFLHIHFSLSKKKKVVARLLLFFLAFFSSQLAALKHSQNLSTGVSHSTSDRGTVKTDNYFTFNFYFCSKFPSSSLSFNSNSSNYRVIGGAVN